MAASLTDPLAGLKPAEIEAYRLEARRESWRRGTLRFRLDDTQQIIYDRLKAEPSGRYFLNCSRRLGKSFVMLAIAAEVCIKTRNARVVYIAPTAKDAATIATDNWITLAEHCPSALGIDYKAQDKELHFPQTGSIIRFKATNGEHAKDLRGGRADLVILDEAGTMDSFEHVLYDIVEPMVASTGERPAGRILIATTPAVTTGHDSHKVYMQYAAQGLVAEFTLNDNPRIPRSEKVSMLTRHGEDPAGIPDILSGKILPKMTRAKREYYCKWVTEAEEAVVPEYAASANAARPQCYTALPPPPFRHCFTAMDPGMKDNTGILFGYWDWLNQRLVIEDEWLKPNAGTPVVAAAIKAKEDELWRGAPNIERVSDHDLRLVRDLGTLHKLHFSMADKKDRRANIMLMRQWFHGRQIYIHPRCVNLDRQLQNAVHNRKGNDFVRDDSEDGLDGHYDLVAALYYLVRYVNTRRDVNPYPPGWLPRGQDEQPGIRTRLAERKSSGLSLFDDTPVGRRLARAGRRRAVAR